MISLVDSSGDLLFIHLPYHTVVVPPAGTRCCVCLIFPIVFGNKRKRERRERETELLLVDSTRRCKQQGQGDTDRNNGNTSTTPKTYQYYSPLLCYRPIPFTIHQQPTACSGSVMRIVFIATFCITAVRIPQARSRTYKSTIATTAAFLQRNPQITTSRRPSSSTTTSSNTMSNLNMVTMDSPSAQRNKDPIWRILQSTIIPSLIKEGKESSSALNVLEIAAGCGIHTTYFVEKMVENKMAVHWYPTDPDPPSLQSLQERVEDSMRTLPDDYQIAKPLKLTLDGEGIMEHDTKDILGSQTMNLIICINMIHISPWSATLGLFELASQRLCSGGILMTYGPYKVNGNAAPSNLQFDESLKGRNPEWGVRDLERVQAAAEENKLKLLEIIEMPANNMCLIFTKD